VRAPETLQAEAGPGGQETTTTKAPSKTEFVTQANALCAALEKQLDEIEKGAEYNDTPQGTADAADKMADLTDKTLSDLKALPQPAEDPKTLTDMYDGLGKGVAMLRELGQAAAAQDKVKTGDVVMRMETHMDIVNAKAAAYGLAECAKS
jgi:hypothetical protein